MPLLQTERREFVMMGSTLEDLERQRLGAAGLVEEGGFPIAEHTALIFPGVPAPSTFPVVKAGMQELNWQKKIAEG